MTEAEKQVLGLALPTDPRWVNIAEKNIEEILIDHAYCEQKAASTCISIIVRYPEFTEMVDVLMPIVSEEWSHFERVMAELKKRNVTLKQRRVDEYVQKVQQVFKKGGSRQQQIVERLLESALIEARSCERFRLLSLYLQDEELKKFYHELMVSEAGHYKVFLQLAKKASDPDEVEKRWREILQAEAKILEQLDIRADRMH